MVHRRCLALLRDPERAMEATQDVFVQVLRRRETLDLRHASSFLYQLATNVSLNLIRTRRRHPEEGEEALLVRIAAAPEADDRLAAARTLQRLFAVDPPGLRVSSRTLAVMHLVDGMTLEEVADETEMSVSGVRKRLRTLREHLSELEGV